MPRGGARVGAGRKPKARIVGFVSPAAVGMAPTGQAAPGAPKLIGRAAEVWAELEPHALKAQTLVPQTVHAFGMMCRAVAQLEAIEAEIAGGGLVIQGANGDAANPLLTQHRGFLQRVDAMLARFGLTAFGKPVASTAAGQGPAPVNPWARVVNGGR